MMIFLILTIGWFVLSFIRIKLHENLVNKEVGDLEAKMAAVEKSNGALEKFINLMSNPAFLERQARIRLNYKNPGEEVVFVYPDNSAKASPSLDFNIELDKLPNYLKWIYYLLGH